MQNHILFEMHLMHIICFAKKIISFLSGKSSKQLYIVKMVLGAGMGRVAVETKLLLLYDYVT